MSAAADETEAYVLPADADPDEVDSIVLLEEYDGEISELKRPRGPEMSETDDETDAEEQPEENRFVCPADGCETENTGHPEHCPECGAAYRWPAQEAA